MPFLCFSLVCLLALLNAEHSISVMCYIFFWRNLCLLLFFLHYVLNPLQLFSQLPSQTQKDLKCLGVLPNLKILWERKAASALTSTLINIHISLYKCICQAKCHSKSCPFVLIDGRGISPPFKWPVNSDPILKKTHLTNHTKGGEKRKQEKKKISHAGSSWEFCTP